MAGRLNNRDKVKISKAELMSNAWRMVCIGEGSPRPPPHTQTHLLAPFQKQGGRVPGKGGSQVN